MKSLASWLTVFFMAMFWVFRIIVTLSVQYGDDFGGFIVFDNIIEIALLFISILCLILIVKRKLLGGIIYLFGYGYYFGNYIINNLIPILTKGEDIDMIVAQNAIVGLLVILLGIVVVFDIFVEKAKKKSYSDNKTDWFFDNKDYERKMDDRADKNQYRTL